MWNVEKQEDKLILHFSICTFNTYISLIKFVTSLPY